MKDFANVFHKKVRKNGNAKSSLFWIQNILNCSGELLSNVGYPGEMKKANGPLQPLHLEIKN